MQNYSCENIPPKVEVADEDRPRPTKKKTPHVWINSRGFKSLFLVKQVHIRCCFCTPTSLFSYKRCLTLQFTKMHKCSLLALVQTYAVEMFLTLSEMDGAKTATMLNIHMVHVQEKHEVMSTVLSRRCTNAFINTTC
jgi:hypothetical protein